MSNLLIKFTPFLSLKKLIKSFRRDMKNDESYKGGEETKFESFFLISKVNIDSEF